MTSQINQDGINLVFEINEHDVLFGRGGAINGHAGNINFRRVVNEQKNNYLTASKVDKPNIANNVVQIIRKMHPPGRFLAPANDSDKNCAKMGGILWYEVGDRKAKAKASQALRERTKRSAVSILKSEQIEDGTTYTKRIIRSNTTDSVSKCCWDQNLSKDKHETRSSSPSCFLGDDDVPIFTHQQNLSPGDVIQHLYHEDYQEHGDWQRCLQTLEEDDQSKTMDPIPIDKIEPLPLFYADDNEENKFHQEDRQRQHLGTDHLRQETKINDENMIANSAWKHTFHSLDSIRITKKENSSFSQPGNVTSYGAEKHHRKKELAINAKIENEVTENFSKFPELIRSSSSTSIKTAMSDISKLSAAEYFI